MERMFTVGRLFFLGAIVVGAGCEDPASSSGPDPAPVICGEDQRVLDLDCVPCAPGTTNETGDDASGDDTDCDQDCEATWSACTSACETGADRTLLISLIKRK